MEVALVSLDPVEAVASFREAMKLEFLCFSDVEQVAYQAYGVPRGSWGAIAGPQVWGSGLKALLKVGAGLPGRDLFRLHAAFVVDRQPELRFVFYPRHSGQMPDHQRMWKSIAEGSS